MIYSKVTGDGLPVVFIHGFCEDHTLWSKLAATLAPNYRAICLDLPGFGNSTAITNNFSLSEIAEIIHIHLSKKLGFTQYVVLGHSLGGYVGLAMADLYPKQILGLGLINSTSFADDENKKITRAKTADFIDKNGVTPFLESFVKNLFTPQNQQLMVKEQALVKNMGLNLPKQVLINYTLAMRDRLDRSHLLTKMQNFLFVAGLQDIHTTKIDIENQFKLLPNKDNTLILDDVAHMTMFENEKLLIKAIKRFLGNIQTS